MPVAQTEDMKLLHRLHINITQLITLSPFEASQFLALRVVPLAVLPAMREECQHLNRTRCRSNFTY